MKQLVIILTLFSLSSCQAEEQVPDTQTIARDLVKRYILGAETVIDYSSVISGDFNGDGFKDVALVVKSPVKLKPDDAINSSTLWVDDYQSTVSQHNSLLIFHASSQGWQSDNLQIFSFPDNAGALSSPSFELLTLAKQNMNQDVSLEAINDSITGDLIIIPTEAGIDTYIYWHDNRYQLFEPEEIP